ncbi:unnamed protein product [Paramecium primaurelia]|uniref:PARG catalytic Macro domain-containing protein n=1 Tax=Paramecium primaurelia TaxID=5886 RepID=A0A8S1Q2K5_PARPR|nr:unnamed protein product [Paramecium primaurelia]
MIKSISKIFFQVQQSSQKTNNAFKCNLKGFVQQNYLDYIHQTIDFDSTLQNIFNDQKGQLEFKNYLKKEIFNNPDQLRVNLECIYQQWDTQSKVQLKRVEVFRLIMLMYLGLLERDFSQGGFYLIDMVHIKFSNNYLSEQKLKCIQHYIKTFYLNQNAIGDQQIVFSKNSVNKEEFKKKLQENSNQTINFEFTQLKNEDHNNSTVVDFADENIGGLVLDTWNCAQEEIIMLIFPEAIACMIFIPKMKETEAVLIENLKKYSNYTGYEQSFHSFPSMDLQESYNVLSIDAKPFYGENQFTEENIYRELLKCYSGFELSLKNQPNCDISTGRWGCGIFGGNIYLKTLIQFLSYAIAIKQVQQSNQKIIINCVNDQQLYKFGTQLKGLLEQQGTQLNLINLKESILFLQNRNNEKMLQNDNKNIINQLFAILTKDNNESNKVNKEQIQNDFKIKNNRENQQQQQKNVNKIIIGSKIVLACSIAAYAYKTFFK